jgi:hypothetical protein
VELLSHVVGIPWSHALEVNQVVSFVCALDPLNINTSGYFLNFILPIKYLSDLDVEVLADLLHQCVECLRCEDGLLFINRSIFSKRGQVIVV